MFPLPVFEHQSSVFPARRPGNSGKSRSGAGGRGAGEEEEGQDEESGYRTLPPGNHSHGVRNNRPTGSPRGPDLRLRLTAETGDGTS